jgi:hypothetical protein
MLLLNISPPTPFKKSALSNICLQAEVKNVVSYTPSTKQEIEVKEESIDVDARALSGTADSVWFPNICR